ncbi:hypothetical protein [Planococcus sp. ISL-109]|uniref:hypothetical protein n=1 Tax=Planococcus sp. ISL-109 TaxID=2819166 RepID=UPI001BEB9D48|nr:hypothetical protein [Planococcus sp. ISL-109]MBT2581589.1 hypothetical protein [Planococcus sp. ISL-109]
MKLLSSGFYGNSPIYLQNLLLSFHEYANSRKRYGMGYYRFLQQLSIMDEGDRLAEQEFQDREVQAIIRHAVQHSPFYRELYKNKASDIQSADGLTQLPIIEETLFAERIEEIHTETQRKKEAFSSGSAPTGFPPLQLTNLDVQRQTAAIDYFKKQNGVINLEMKRATFYSGDFVPHAQTEGAFWRDIYYLNQRIYSAHHCMEPFLESVIRNLNEFRPDFIDGLPSAILALSRFINDQCIILTFQTAAVFVETEILSDSERLEIESAFGCIVRRWSMKSERSPFLFECAAGNLHFNMRTGVLEFGEKGEVLLTRFHTHGTPLIRLKIKDRLLPVHCPCPCGSAHPVVRKPTEPESEYLQSKSRGKVTSLYLATVREKFRQLAPAMQFVQNSLDEIIIWIDGEGTLLLETEQQIRQEMISIFGADMRFTVSRRHVETADSGRYPGLVINNLQKHICQSDCGMN